MPIIEEKDFSTLDIPQIIRHEKRKMQEHTGIGHVIMLKDALRSLCEIASIISSQNEYNYSIPHDIIQLVHFTKNSQLLQKNTLRIACYKLI